MSEPGSGSWDEVVERLRRSAAEVRAAVRQPASSSVEGDAAEARLKTDVTRLEQAASDLLSTLSAAIGERRTELESSFDRERAKRSADQMRSSLEEFSAQAADLASTVGTAATSTVKQAQPELEAAARALEDIAGSATAWARSVIDPPRDRPESSASAGRPPLDDL